ncbi:MAG: hypothetical protein IKQ89_04245 [Muribaculaceae bacterium]|nr:hypothetical protein [Muribaculaceae bacterium]
MARRAQSQVFTNYTPRRAMARPYNSTLVSGKTNVRTLLRVILAPLWGKKAMPAGMVGIAFFTIG